MDQKEIEIALGEETMKQLQDLIARTGETIKEATARLLAKQAAKRWSLPRAIVHVLKRGQ